MSVTIGEVIVSWQVATLYTTNFLGNATVVLQSAALSFNIFQKIFNPYGLQTPTDFDDLYNQIINKQLQVTEESIAELSVFLINRFILSAEYFFISCV